MNTEEKYQTAVEAIRGAGGTPFPVSDTLIDVIKIIIEEDDLDLVIAFKEKRSQTIEQLKEGSTLSESEILEKTESLAKRGVIFNQPNRQGVMVYRLLPLINVGTFEYTFMKKLERSDKNAKIAELFKKLFSEMGDLVQNNYDQIISYMDKSPAVDRTVPVLENKEGKKIVIEINKEVGSSTDVIVPTQRVEELIQKFDEIAVGHCFCRHFRDLIEEPCKQTDLRENCFTFGKSARYTSEQGFSRMVPREEALTILKKSEEDGLVHKAYHPNFDTHKDETSICNCCKCCCGNSGASRVGPTVNATNYVAKVNPDLCVGCGTCIEHCHNNAILLNDNGKAEKIEDYCIGCGVCAYFCKQNAISLVEKERIVRIPPRRR